MWGEERGLRPATRHHRISATAPGPKPGTKTLREAGGWVGKATEAGGELGPSIRKAWLSSHFMICSLCGFGQVA